MQKNGFTTFDLLYLFLFLIFRNTILSFLFRIAVNSDPTNHVFSITILQTEGRGSCGNLGDTFPECDDRVFAAGHIGIASPAILPDISARGPLDFRKVNYPS